MTYVFLKNIKATVFFRIRKWHFPFLKGILRKLNENALLFREIDFVDFQKTKHTDCEFKMFEDFNQ